MFLSTKVKQPFLTPASNALLCRYILKRIALAVSNFLNWKKIVLLEKECKPKLVTFVKGHSIDYKFSIVKG